MLFKKILLFLMVVSFFVIPVVASAQLKADKELPGTNLATSVLGCGATDPPTCIVEGVLKFILGLAFIVAVVQVIISGYRLTLSRGNEEALAGAKRNLFWAIGGIVVIALSWAILTFIIDIVSKGTQGEVASLLI